MEALKDEYCPPLDEALFIALASDYDIANDNERQDLKQVLNGLKEQAVIEQDLELATPHIEEPVHSAGTLEGSVASLTNSIEDLKTTSNEHESSTDTSSFELEHGLENATTSEKEKYLKHLFPGIENVQINETLIKCQNDIHRSIEELLNLSFIHDDDFGYSHEEAKPELKGVDAFFSADGSTSNKHKKSKKHKHKPLHEEDYYSDNPSASGTTTPNNIWSKSNDEVDFIVSRTYLPQKAVLSVYHQQSNNLPKTLRALITKESTSDLATRIRDDPVLQIQVEELRYELPISAHVDDKLIFGALLLAQMFPPAAHDLLKEMSRAPDTSTFSKGQKLSNVAHYAPIYIDTSNDEPTRKRGSPTIYTPASTSFDSAISQAGVHTVQASTAFSQASAAARRARSDKSMSGVSAYYASVAHGHIAKQKSLLSHAADVFVSSQSTPTSLDLHGVTVEQAVRIARTNVERWYAGLGDKAYVRGGVGEGYRIIVGVGSHSKDGIGRIGPAVSKMLMREGWRVNVQRGEVFVEGRARRG